MTLNQITIIVEPQEGILLNDNPISARQYHACDRLANELQENTQAIVTIVEDFLGAAMPPEGYVLWFRANNREPVLEHHNDSPNLPNVFWHRIILMADKSKADYNFLNIYGLAGAVSNSNYIQWKFGSYKLIFLYGLSTVIQEITGSPPQRRGRYAEMIDEPLGFAGTLIRYLEIYDRMISLMPEQLHPSESDPKWPLIWDILKKEGEKQNLNGVNLSQSDLSSINLKQVELAEANLSQSNWSFAYLQEADLQGANLTKAKFIETNFTRANFRRTVLIETDLSKAVLLGANLEETDLSTAILTNALYDQHTKWPKGFDPEKAGAIFKDASHKL